MTDFKAGARGHCAIDFNDSVQDIVDALLLAANVDVSPKQHEVCHVAIGSRRHQTLGDRSRCLCRASAVRCEATTDY